MDTPGEDDQLHILVIDDDEDMRALFCSLLLPEGHQVFAAGSAEEGLALLPYDTFQVAFLDHHLPGMEGLVFGEYLRHNNPHMKVALVTGAADPQLGREAEGLGIVVIPKPFRPRDLFALVDAYRREADQRMQESLQTEDPSFDVPLAEHFEELPKIFDIPNLPARVEERLVKEAKRSLAHLRSVSRYNDRDRVVAYSALLALQVLGVKIPKGSTGALLTEEYDEVMRSRGRKAAFS